MVNWALNSPQISSWFSLDLLILDISFEGGKISHSPIINKAWRRDDTTETVISPSTKTVYLHQQLREGLWKRRFLGHPKSFWFKSEVGLIRGISNSFQGMPILPWPRHSWRIAVPWISAWASTFRMPRWGRDIALQTFLGLGPGQATVLCMSATHQGISFSSFCSSTFFP